MSCCNLENKLSEIIGQPVGCVMISRSSASRWEHTGYLHGLIQCTLSFTSRVKLNKETFGSLKIIYEDSHNTNEYYYDAHLLKGKETDDLFFACAKDFLPNLKEHA
jgi:hypothetical protein